jgi:hypothetical protein
MSPIATNSIVVGLKDDERTFSMLSLIFEFYAEGDYI